MNGAIERGSYARFALATPNDGDQTVTVFFNVTGEGEHYDTRPPGYYWFGPEDNTSSIGKDDIRGPYETEDRALDEARAWYGYGPLAEPE